MTSIYMQGVVIGIIKGEGGKENKTTLNRPKRTGKSQARGWDFYVGAAQKRERELDAFSCQRGGQEASAIKRLCVSKGKERWGRERSIWEMMRTHQRKKTGGRDPRKCKCKCREATQGKRTAVLRLMGRRNGRSCDGENGRGRKARPRWTCPTRERDNQRDSVEGRRLFALASIAPCGFLHKHAIGKGRCSRF